MVELDFEQSTPLPVVIMGFFRLICFAPDPEKLLGCGFQV